MEQKFTEFNEFLVSYTRGCCVGGSRVTNIFVTEFALNSVKKLGKTQMIPENVSKWPARKKYFHFI